MPYGKELVEPRIYYQKPNNEGNAPSVDELSLLRQKLMLPFGLDADEPSEVFPRIVRHPSEFTLQEAKVGTNLHEQAQNIVRYQYNKQYSEDGIIHDLDDKDRQDTDTTSQVVVVTSNVDGEPIVFATVTLTAGSNLELYEHMERKDGTPWPSQTEKDDPAGEFGRFAFHPVLTEVSREWHGLPVPLENLLKLPSGIKISSRQLATILNREIYILTRGLYTYGAAFFLQRGVPDLLYVISQNINNLLHHAGIEGTELAQARQRTSNPFHQSIAALYPKYWHPEDPKLAPKVFLAPWELKSIEWSHLTQDDEIITETLPAVDIRALASSDDLTTNLHDLTTRHAKFELLHP